MFSVPPKSPNSEFELFIAPLRCARRTRPSTRFARILFRGDLCRSFVGGSGRLEKSLGLPRCAWFRRNKPWSFSRRSFRGIWSSSRAWLKKSLGSLCPTMLQRRPITPCLDRKTSTPQTVTILYLNKVQIASKTQNMAVLHTFCQVRRCLPDNRISKGRRIRGISCKKPYKTHKSWLFLLKLLFVQIMTLIKTASFLIKAPIFKFAYCYAISSEEGINRSQNE